MKKILLISILINFLFGSNKEINSNDLTYIVDSTDTVCAVTPESLVRDILTDINNKTVSSYKFSNSYGSMVSIEVEEDNEIYSLVLFSNITMCNFYKDRVKGWQK